MGTSDSVAEGGGHFGLPCSVKLNLACEHTTPMSLWLWLFLLRNISMRSQLSGM
jgi:hypothetical protein